MNKEQAIAEARRRSNLKVTADGDTEDMYLASLGNDQFSVHRWIDLPQGARLIARYQAGELLINLE